MPILYVYKKPEAQAWPAWCLDLSGVPGFQPLTLLHSNQALKKPWLPLKPEHRSCERPRCSSHPTLSRYVFSRERQKVGRMVNGFHKCEDRLSELSLGCQRQGSGRTQGSHWEEPRSAEDTPLLVAWPQPCRSGQAARAPHVIFGQLWQRPHDTCSLVLTQTRVQIHS